MRSIQNRKRSFRATGADIGEAGFILGSRWLPFDAAADFLRRHADQYEEEDDHDLGVACWKLLAALGASRQFLGGSFWSGPRDTVERFLATVGERDAQRYCDEHGLRRERPANPKLTP